MAVFTWIALGIVAVLALLSGLCALLNLLLDDARWRGLAVRLFRFALVGVLFYVNGIVWGHLVGGFF